MTIKTQSSMNLSEELLPQLAGLHHHLCPRRKMTAAFVDTLTGQTGRIAPKPGAGELYYTLTPASNPLPSPV